MDYEKLLDKAYKELPEVKIEDSRFEIPKVQGHIQGSKTIITNFVKIAQVFRREIAHLQKYLLRELASPAFLADYKFLGILLHFLVNQICRDLPVKNQSLRLNIS